MQTVKHVIISAAGMGTRLEMNMPKCLVEIAGKKIIQGLLELVSDFDDVRVVVGFMEEEVIREVNKIRKDVVFVRNSDYRTTSNCHSIYLATHNLKDPFLIIDGDLIIDKDSFLSFLKECKLDQSLIGITPSKTEDAVFVNVDSSGKVITGFSRDMKNDFEWCGIAYLKDIKISKDGGYVFEELKKHLPLQAHVVECSEIDTPEDLHAVLVSKDESSV
jgi:choline kinase